MVNLTDAAAKAAKPGAAARDIADGTVPGLALRVLPSGEKAWALRAKLGGRRVRIDLGRYPSVTLKSAREIANRHIGTIERGDDPRYEGCTVEEAVKEWLATKKGNRSIANERRRFELHVLPTIGTAGVRSVKPEMLSKLLRGMTTGDDPTPVEANRVYTSLRGLLRWCRRNLGCPDDPSALIDKPTKEEPSAVRRREGMEPLLDMTELAQLWKITSTLPGDVLGDLVKSLLLVPLRREEWTALSWPDFQKDFTADGWRGPALRIMATRMKGKRPANVPLPFAAVDILESRRKLTGRGKYVFAVPGRNTSFAGWRRGADTLRTALGSRTDWSPKTIRTSIATALVRDLGADELLVGRILQHSPRNALGITDVYQRSPRLAEQAELLTKWANHLMACAERLKAAEPVVHLRVVAQRDWKSPVPKYHLPSCSFEELTDAQLAELAPLLEAWPTTKPAAGRR